MQDQKQKDQYDSTQQKLQSPRAGGGIYSNQNCQCWWRRSECARPDRAGRIGGSRSPRRQHRRAIAGELRCRTQSTARSHCHPWLGCRWRSRAWLSGGIRIDRRDPRGLDRRTNDLHLCRAGRWHGIGCSAICGASRSRGGRAGSCVRNIAVCVRRQAPQRSGPRSSGPSQRDRQRSGLLRKRSDGGHGRATRRYSSGVFQGRYDSDNRAHDALAQALKSPLMDRGRTLADAARVLVQVAGGPAMTLSEVEIVMKELGRHVNEETQILFGTAVDGRLGDRLSVTIISSFTADEDLPQTQPPLSSAPAMPAVWEEPREAPPKIEVEPEPASVEDFQSAEDTPVEEPNFPEVETAPAPPVESVSNSFEVVDPPEPPVSAPRRKSASAREEKVSTEKSIQAKQEVLQFEPVNRGRFEKSEPTIVEGEDLDVPTYLRKKIKVK